MKEEGFTQRSGRRIWIGSRRLRGLGKQQSCGDKGVPKCNLGTRGIYGIKIRHPEPVEGSASLSQLRESLD
jgi:hypothetical protein